MTTFTKTRLFIFIRNWGLTIGAHVTSFYILDLIAVIAGFTLVGIIDTLWPSALSSLHIAYAIFFLVATYILWGFTLHKNLKSNWRLLEETGTSTNILSKAGYDIAQSFKHNKLFQKILANAGYIVTELSKEVPYYIGAFGISVVSEQITAVESIVFLAGANLGAALYEYAVAKGTLRLLGLSTKIRVPEYASFDIDWSPSAYLDEYYHTVKPDEAATIRFFVKEMARIPTFEKVLFFGTGPTLHHVFLATQKTKEVHLADYIARNIDELRRWVEGKKDSHNWAPFVEYTLECEGVENPSPEMILLRQEDTRKKITRFFSKTNADNTDPLGKEWRGKYDIVFSPFCADSATADKKVWERYMRNIASLVAPGGHFFVAALKDCTQYTVGGRNFPCANINTDDMRHVLKFDFSEEKTVIVEENDLEECGMLGYNSIILVHAIKKI